MADDGSYEPILSQTIVASVDNALAGVTPGFCESIRMTTFTCE
jgi:Ca2+-dependent lipid-binding protein